MNTLALPIQGFRPFESFASKGERPSTFPKGRRCALGACGCGAPVLLSIYNPNETCWICTVKIDRSVRAAA